MTRRTCIAIVDASRARLFVHERAVDAEGTRDELVERFDLVDPGRRLGSNDLFADSRIDSNRAGDRHFGYDDHRVAHRENMDDQFAREVVAKIDEIVAATGSPRLVICASPHMLGVLRGLVKPREGLAIQELARNFVKSTIPELREHLVAHDLLGAQS
ncbi:MAG TPA: host attachment protein [Kofleriaceae bacterium]|nr:host attachment protein [Kofleriaceae bacterium]